MRITLAAKGIAVFVNRQGFSNFEMSNCKASIEYFLSHFFRDNGNDTRPIGRDVNLDSISKVDGFQRIAFLDDAATHLVDKQLVAAVDDSMEQIILDDTRKGNSSP